MGVSERGERILWPYVCTVENLHFGGHYTRILAL